MLSSTRPFRKSLGGILAVLLTSCLLVDSVSASSGAISGRNENLEALMLSPAELSVASEPVAVSTIASTLAAPQNQVLTALDELAQLGSEPPVAYLDRRTARPSTILLSGIPWIPGDGNHLTWSSASLGAEPEAQVIRQRLIDEASDFLADHPSLFRVPSSELVVDKDGTQMISRSHQVVRFAWAPHGIEVQGAHMVFRVRHGNLVQLGSEGITEASRVPATVAWPDSKARSRLASYLGQPRLQTSSSLRVIPFAAAEPWATGEGVEYRLVWELELDDSPGIGRWVGGVDAQTGEVLYFGDRNLYGHVEGKVRTEGHGGLVDRPMPYADYRQNPTQYADADGDFPSTPSSALRSFLWGRYVGVSSACGVIDADPFSGNNIYFGGLNSTNCSSADVTRGGEGNTTAARSTYYYLNRIKDTAREYLDNPWLDGWLPASTDLLGTCNAFWDPATGSVNFLAGDAPFCENLGEVDSVIYHEFGHGLDSNDGTGISGSSEAYADIIAFFETGDSCMGRGASMVCGNDTGYACPTCDGVREVDWREHSGGPRTPTDTLQVCGFSGNPFYQGPCGRQPHCESSVAAEAMWDLAVYDLPAMGLTSSQAWDKAKSLWYATTSSSGLLHRCLNDAGAASNTLYSTLMVADDCDGNLSNGTPHAPAIYAALARHDIATGSSTDGRHQENDCGGSSSVSVTLTSPQSGASVSGLVSLAASASADSGVARVEFFANGTLVATDTSSPYSATWDSSDATSSSEIEAVAYDNSGNEASDSAVVNVDNDLQAPICTITSPANGDVLDGNVALRASASDADGDVEKVDFFVNGSLVGTDSSSPYNVTWNSDTMPAGSTVDITCRAEDDDGLTGTSTPIIVGTEGGFQILLVDPLPGQIIGRFTNSLRMSAVVDRPPGVTVPYVEFFVNGEFEYRDFGQPYSTVGPTDFPDGSQVTVHVEALVDDVRIPSPPVTVTIDGIRPTVEVSSPSPGETVSGTLQVSVNASDANGMDRVQIFVGGNSCLKTAAPFTCTFNTLHMSNGPRIVWARGTDNSGNETSTSQFSIEIFNPAEIRVERAWNDTEVLDGWVVDLPPTVDGQQQDYPFRIKNLGRDSLEIENPASLLASHPCISLHNAPESTVAYNSETELEVRVDCPLGQHEVAMTIENNDADEDPFDLTLRVDVTEAPECHEDAYHLCLQNNRFRVGSTFIHPDPPPGTNPLQAARAVPFGQSEESGFFWFFGPNNLESVVKILDGRDINDSFWVFHGASTHVAYTLHIEDLFTGETKDFLKPVDTFCGSADVGAFPQSPAAELVFPGGTEKWSALPIPQGFFEALDAEPVDGKAAQTHRDEIEKGGACVPSPTALCFHDGRIKVEVDWIDHGGVSGVGRAVPGTAETGFFWFFGDGNLELMVKVLDGRPENGHWWVYYASMSDVDFTIRVTDTLSQNVAIYHNPSGTYCGGGDPFALPDS